MIIVITKPYTIKKARIFLKMKGYLVSNEFINEKYLVYFQNEKDIPNLDEYELFDKYIPVEVIAYLIQNNKSHYHKITLEDFTFGYIIFIDNIS